MLKHIPKLPSLFAATLAEWRRDNPSLLAAALAYYAFFSTIPVLVISAAIGSLFLGQAAVDGQLHSALVRLFGEKAAGVMQAALANTYAQESGAVVTMAVALLIFGASYFFVQLRNVLNTIWKVRERKQAFEKFVESRLMSLVAITGISVLLLLWLTVSASMSTFVLLSSHTKAFAVASAEVANFVLLLIVSALLFAMVYKLLPSVKLTWEDVGLGAAVTAFLFVSGVQIVALYLSKINLASVYGVAGSLVGLLVWLYVSAQLFIFGAIFTKVYASMHGSHRKR